MISDSQASCNTETNYCGQMNYCARGTMLCLDHKKKTTTFLNKATGQKMMSKARGRGSYVMEVQFVGGEKTRSMVDSGAEENVCPYDWGQQFGIRDPVRWKNFSGANGSRIEHYGTRDIKVVSSTF